MDAQGDRGAQPVLKQVWATASQAVDRLVDIAEDYAPEGVSRGTVWPPLPVAVAAQECVAPVTKPCCSERACS